MLKTKQTFNGLLTYRTTSLYIGDVLDLYEEYSPDEVDLLKVLAKDRNVILAGANIGAIAVPVGKAAKNLTAFEPNPIEYELLWGNIQNCGSCLPCCKALGEKFGNMYCPVLNPEQPGNVGGASLLGWTSQDNTTPVQVIPLDYLKQKDVGLIIADTEGMEIHVVKGALETIKRDKPYLYLENNFEAIPPDANNPYGRPCRAAELMKLVESLGYTMYYHFPKLTNKAKEGELAYGVVSFNMLCVHQYKGYEFAKLEQASWHLSPVVKKADGQYVVNQR